jgi:signal transduction histidine kinase
VVHPEVVAEREELWVLGEIAGEAAHELRNALAVIAASASLIRGAEAGAVDTHVAKIERSTRIAQGVVDGLMALARGETIRGAPVVLAHAIAEARTDVPKGATWEDAVPPEAAVRGNEILLSRMFRVLYENALQAGASKIVTTVTRGAEAITVDVTDDGRGVPEDVQATLFDALVTTKAQGTGLGLALAKRVARAHGGDAILVPSAKGAHFRITLRA